MKDVFIFSGTTEGRSLARYLASRGVPVHVSVATEYGADVMEADGDIDVRVGSCGGTEGIADIITKKGYGIVVDATHPYATRISKHIREACGCTGVRYVRVRRDDSSMACDDDLIEVTPKSIRLRKKTLNTELRMKEMMRRRRELEAQKK